MRAKFLRWWRASWAILLAGAAGLAAGAVATRAAAGDQPAPGDRAGIEAIVRDYILQHPEIIPEAMDRLRQNQAAAAITASHAALVAPFAGAWAGNPQGDVTLVMFTDYACGYCRASAPDIERLLADDPKLKVVWREIPVLGPPSEQAARVALAAAKAGGGYLAFHRTMFASGRPDATTIAAAARAAGQPPLALAKAAAAPDIQREIATNLSLAAKLGIGGTPAFVIGDQMISGAVGHDALAKAIAAARAHA